MKQMLSTLTIDFAYSEVARIPATAFRNFRQQWQCSFIIIDSGTGIFRGLNSVPEWCDFYFYCREYLG